MLVKPESQNNPFNDICATHYNPSLNAKIALRIYKTKQLARSQTGTDEEKGRNNTIQLSFSLKQTLKRKHVN